MSEEVKESTEERFNRLATATLNIYGSIGDSSGPWNPEDIDKMDAWDLDDFREVVEMCRFFYKRDPLASTVVNRSIDLAVNDLIFIQGDLSKNEFSIYEALKDDILDFAENMALEYLVSGLVVPEVNYAVVSEKELRKRKIKRYTSLYLPVEMWLRDPATMIINKSLASSNPSYYVQIPEDLIYFIIHEGEYPDGTEDFEKYRELLTYYPEFVAKIRNGETKVLIENDKIIRRRYLTDSPYPIPYLYASLESMKHKRNLRKMDYAIASRAISAIQVFKLGSDEFPVLEDNQEQFDQLKAQMTWRNDYTNDIERIFQLFANHTLQIEWVFPPMDILLDDARYKDINQDIIFGMGFPRVLIMGESERSNTSNSEFAMMPAIKTVDKLRKEIIRIVRDIVFEISEYNKFSSYPEVVFAPLDMHEFKTFIEALGKLYDSGNLSRESYSKVFGYNWNEEIRRRVEEQKKIEETNIPEFQPQPHSQNPQYGAPNQAKPINKNQNKTKNQ